MSEHNGGSVIKVSPYTPQHHSTLMTEAFDEEGGWRETLFLAFGTLYVGVPITSVCHTSFGPVSVYLNCVNPQVLGIQRIMQIHSQDELFDAIFFL